MKIKPAACVFIVLISAGLSSTVLAEQFILRNGDVITGDVVSESSITVTVDTDALGEVKIRKGFIESRSGEKPAEPGTPEPEPPAPVSEWEKSLSAGYLQSGGNTEKSQFNFELKADKKKPAEEWNFRFTSYFASNNNKTDARKFYTMGRFADSFGRGNKWFRFVKLEADHDRFSNIDYRVTPGAGAGYWFEDREDLKLTADAALAYEYTSFHDGTDSEGQIVLVPHGYFEKRLFKSLRFSQDLTLYPSLEDIEQFRFRSESAFKDRISDSLSWKVSFIDEYNSMPGGDSEKNDYRLIMSLEYGF